MQFELIRAASITESLHIVAAQIFGKSDTKSQGSEVITDIASLAGTDRWG